MRGFHIDVKAVLESSLWFDRKKLTIKTSNWKLALEKKHVGNNEYVLKLRYVYKFDPAGQKTISVNKFETSIKMHDIMITDTVGVRDRNGGMTKTWKEPDFKLLLYRQGFGPKKYATAMLLYKSKMIKI